MLSFEENNVLGQILDNTFGYSSTTVSPTMSIKCSLQGDVLTVRYTTIVNLASERNIRDQIKRFADESVKLTNDYMKNVRSEFKRGATRALKVKQLGTSDSVEMITTSPYTPRKMAYYRRSTNYTIE